MAELARQRVANAQAASASLAGSSPAASALRSGVVESVRRATVTRERQVRALPPEPHALVVENGDDAGLSTRKLWVRVPPGVLVRLLAVGELATPPASGAGDRRFDSCQPDLRGRGAAVLASLMSSRSWVRIPPALPPGGRSSAEQSARLSGERLPVRIRSSPLRGGRGVDGSTRGCEPRRRRFEPGRPPLTSCGR